MPENLLSSLSATDSFHIAKCYICYFLPQYARNECCIAVQNITTLEEESGELAQIERTWTTIVETHWRYCSSLEQDSLNWSQVRICSLPNFLPSKKSVCHVGEYSLLLACWWCHTVQGSCPRTMGIASVLGYSFQHEQSLCNHVPDCTAKGGSTWHADDFTQGKAILSFPWFTSWSYI